MARKINAPVNIRLATSAEIAHAKGEALRLRANALGQSVSHGTRTTLGVIGAFGSGLFGIKPKEEEEEKATGMVWVVADGKIMQVPSNAVTSCSA